MFYKFKIEEEGKVWYVVEFGTPNTVGIGNRMGASKIKD